MVPKDMRDNECIKSGYRINQKSFSDIISTIFRIHNQTFNIWSHMLGVLFYICVAIGIWLAYPNMLNYGKIGSHEILSHYRHNNTDIQLEKYINLKNKNMQHTIGHQEIHVNEFLRDYKSKAYNNTDYEIPRRKMAASSSIRENMKTIEQLAYVFVEDAKT